MIPRHLSSRERTILFACIGTAIVYCIYHVVFKPLAEKETVLMQQIDIASQQLQKHVTAIKKAKAIHEMYTAYLVRFSQNGSDEQMMSSMISEIDSIASRMGIRIADMKPQKVKREDFHNKFLVTLNLGGSLEAIVRFFYTLQDKEHSFGIDEIFMEKDPAQPSALKCRLVVSRTLIVSTSSPSLP